MKITKISNGVKIRLRKKQFQEVQCSGLLFFKIFNLI